VRRLFLVRHAPTHAKSMVGWSDLAADCSDAAGFARLDALLPREAMLVSSDLSRAVATADHLGAGRRRLPHVPDLREMNFGAWELRGFAEIEAEAPEHIRAFWESPGDICAPGGESWNALAGRVWAALDRLLVAETGDLVVVSHFGPIVAAIQRADGLTPEVAFAHRIDNLSVTEIAVAGGSWRLKRANHLA
jgi:broad specificity phosphatase PhoE